MSEDWYKEVISPVKGVWVGADVESQNAITFDNLSKGDINEDFIGITYINDGTKQAVLKGIGSKPEEE